jgi:LmbE family N-acetylglucosaminyl deacetylase
LTASEWPSRERGPIGRVLVIAAHPDDAEFKAGGTVARWAAAGAEVSYLVLTDGTAGAEDLSLSRAQVAAIRQLEQRAAGEILGVKDITFLGHRDGGLRASGGLRRQISRVIRQVQPACVFIQSPELNWAFLPDLHPDHRAAGEAALAAIYPDARTGRIHPALVREGLTPWAVSEIWVMGGPRPDTYIDVTEVFDRKLAALHAHASQTRHRVNLADEIGARLRDCAAEGGLPAGRLAEAFQVIDAR